MTQHRAYAVLDVKSVDDDARIIEGTASTPTPDRMGDIVESEGAEFSLPLPLLWQHQHDKPVGEVEFAKASKSGITFRARIAKIAEPGPLKDLVDTAWQAVKAKLVRGVSIGFSPKEYSFIEGTGGIRFQSWDWYELSIVTIPANAEATISAIKSIASEQLAASGRSAAPETPAASGDKPKPVVRRNKMTKRKSISEQIAEWEATRQAKSAEMAEIMEKSEGGETLDSAEQEAFDGLESELGEIDGHIKRLRVLEKHSIATAKEVNTDPTRAERTTVPAQVKAPKPEPGVQFARYARSIMIAKANNRDAVSVATSLYGQSDPHVVEMVQKAEVTAINTTTDVALIGNVGGFADFVSFLRDQTILGKFGTAGIPPLRRVPFYYPLVTQATGGSAHWVGEGKAKPMTRPTWSRGDLKPMTIAALAATTKRALAFSSPSAELALRDDLTAAVVEAEDTAFINPANNGGAAMPAGIAYGVSGPIVSSGYDADAVREDVRAAMAKFVAANNPLTQGVWVMSGTNALALSIMINPLGQPEFPGITMNGGTFFGLPVIVSQAAGTYVVLMNASDVWLADDGGVTVDMSTEASLEMLDDALEGDSVSPTPATAMVSMFQTNSVAIRVERSINWARRRPTGVTYISGVLWGIASS